MNCRSCNCNVADLPQSVCPRCFTVNWNDDISGVDKTLAIDFDGVIHLYSKGWRDGHIYDPPVEGAIGSMKKLQHAGFNLIIFTARADLKAVKEWMMDWWSTEACIQYDRYDVMSGASNIPLATERRSRICNAHQIPQITNQKPGALAYIDDRAYQFRGWREVVLDFVKPE